ncbi:MAG: hypothetical protein KJO42_01735, partial [Silicimonas sp.]|nr:hypothetical protein [Silicimonas sp.]
PGVVVLGDSLMVYCIDEEILGASLENASETHDIQGLLFATPNQSTYEMAAIVDQANLAPGSVVLIGLSQGLFVKPTGTKPESILTQILENPRLPFQSVVLDEEARLAGAHPPFRTGMHAIDNSGFYIARKTALVKHVVLGAEPYGDPLTAHWLPFVDNPEFHAEEREQVGDTLKFYLENSEENFAILARMIERERARRGTRFVIVQAPINPGWSDVAEGAALFDRFVSDAAAFSRQVGAPYLQVSAGQSWESADFFDYEGHLKSPSARTSCSETVASAALARLEAPS